MDDDVDWIELGRLDGAWGVAGWVRVYSLTEPRENVFNYQPWRTDGEPGLLHVREWRRQGPRLVASLAEIEGRDAAEQARGSRLYFDRSALPSLPDQRYYWADLIGLDVVDLEARVLGRVSGLLDAGVHDVLEVEPVEPNRASILIPFVMERFVRRVDFPAGRIEVDWDPDWLADDPRG